MQRGGSSRIGAAMRILITNDDGVNARGLRLLEAGAKRPAPETITNGATSALEHGDPCHVLA